jgi:multidrug efflux system membrane fusion protein
MPKITKTAVVVILSLIVAGGGFWWWQQDVQAEKIGAPQSAATGPGAKAGQGGQRPKGARPAGGPGGAGNPWNAAVPVRVIAAQTTDLKVQIKAIGTVTPLNTVVVQSRVSGPLQKLFFNEGEKVEAGQLLAQIDPAPYQVKLAQAEGTQQQNVAQLENAEADLALYQKLKQ